MMESAIGETGLFSGRLGPILGRREAESPSSPVQNNQPSPNHRRTTTAHPAAA